MGGRGGWIVELANHLSYKYLAFAVKDFHLSSLVISVLVILFNVYKWGKEILKNWNVISGKILNSASGKIFFKILPLVFLKN